MFLRRVIHGAMHGWHWLPQLSRAFGYFGIASGAQQKSPFEYEKLIGRYQRLKLLGCEKNENDFFG